MAGPRQKMTCLIDNKHNMRVFKKNIKLLSSTAASKQRVHLRLTKDFLCIHNCTSAAALEHNGRFLFLNHNFFKEILAEGGSLELSVDLKMLSQTIAKTKDQSELCIQMEQKSAEVGSLRLLSSREGVYDKVVKLKANVVEGMELGEFAFSLENVVIESPPDNFDKLLNVFAGEAEVVMRMTPETVEFHNREIEGDQGLNYAVSTKTFSKYPLPGTSANLEVVLPLEVAELVVGVAKERSLPVRVILEQLEGDTGNVFLFCEPITGEFRCIGTALSVKMIPEPVDPREVVKEMSAELSRVSIQEGTSPKEEQKIKGSANKTISAVRKTGDNALSQSTLAFINEIGAAEPQPTQKDKVVDNSKLSQKGFFGGGANDDYI